MASVQEPEKTTTSALEPFSTSDAVTLDSNWHLMDHYLADDIDLRVEILDQTITSRESVTYSVILQFSAGDDEATLEAPTDCGV